MPKLICDRASYAITQRTYTDEGFLRVPGRVARAGNVQDYYASELGLTDRNPMDVLKVYRPPGEVFDSASLDTYNGVDVTDDHPETMVDTDTYRAVSRGVVVSAGAQDGDFVQCDIIIKDKDAIKSVETGKVQLSAGYSCEYDFTGGVTSDGVAYDAIQKNIRINHVALVDRARAGAQARLFDGNKKEAVIMPNLTLDNGRQITVDDAATAALIQDNLDRKQATIDTQSALIDDQKVTIDELTVKASDAEMSKRVAAVTKSMDNARKLLGGDFTCDSFETIEVQRTACAKLYPSLSFDGKSAAYIEGMFDSALATHDADMAKMREALMKKGAKEEDVKDMSMEEMKDMMSEYDKKESKTNDSHSKFANDADPKKTEDTKVVNPYLQAKQSRATAWQTKE